MQYFALNKSVLLRTLSVYFSVSPLNCVSLIGAYTPYLLILTGNKLSTVK